MSKHFHWSIALLLTVVLTAALFGSVIGNVHVARAAVNIWTVNDLGDSGTTNCQANAGIGGPLCQLRDALNKATDGDTITFSVIGTIAPGSTLTIAHNVTLQGPGAANLTIADTTPFIPPGFSIFTVTSSANSAVISGLTLEDQGTASAEVGGDIYNNGGLVINNCVLVNSAASSGGGSIYNGDKILTNLSSATLVVNNTTFIGNTSSSGARGGGAIFNSAGGDLTIHRSTFNNNLSVASLGGGAIVNYGGTLVVTDSTFANNTAGDGNGGAIYSAAEQTVQTASLLISNSTLSTNQAIGAGGAIYNDAGSSLTVANSTISGNKVSPGKSSSHGGGIYIAPSILATIGSTIVAGNTFTGGSGNLGPDLYGALTSFGYNLIGNSSSATGLVASDQQNVDPLLNPLADNGGPTQTMALKVNSPAIGAGSCGGFASNPPAPAAPTDQRGIIRKSPCDVGAFETQPITLNPTVVAPGVINNFYNQVFTAASSIPNTAFTFNSSDTLPPGLTFNSATSTTITLSGSPTVSGIYLFSLSVSANSFMLTQSYTLSIAPLITLSPPNLPGGVTGQPYNQTITASGGASPYTFVVTGGSLPTGLVLSSGGALSGTPSDAEGSAFTITATDANNFTGSQTYSVNFYLPTPTPTNTPTPARADTIGVFRNGAFLLRLHNTTGNADTSVVFSRGTKPYPVVGDWTGSGYDTVGVYDQNTGAFYLCSANDTIMCAAPFHVQTFSLGNPNDTPLAGRWINGAPTFGAGVFRPSNGLIYLKNALTTGFADYAMILGIPGDTGLAGDWNSDGIDSPGVYRPSLQTFFLTDQVCNCSATGSHQFGYGNSGDAPVMGDWIGQGYDGVGLFRQTNGYTYLRNNLTTGFANITFVYGIAGDVPVAGHWQLYYVPKPPLGSVLAPPTFAPTPGRINSGGGAGD